MNDKNNNSETPETRESGPGSQLRKAREASGKSIEDIASQLRLSKAVIDDIENDRHERLPAPIFVRGYIRSYAALVGVDAASINASYQQSSAPADQEISLEVARTKLAGGSVGIGRKQITPMVIAGLVISLAIILWFSQSSDISEQAVTDSVSEQAETQPAEPALEMQASPGTASTVEEKVAGEPRLAEIEAPVAHDTDANVSDSGPQQDKEAPAEESALSGQATDASEQAVEAAGPRIDQLAFVFSGDSWVDVSDAQGKRLIYRMVKSGERRTVSGMPPFKITLGNAPQTQLLRNGKAVDLGTYTRGNVAKFSLGKINE